MLVKFSSTATGSITMFGDPAKQLIKMMGASGNIPGAISAEDLPGAIHQLLGNLEQSSASDDEPARHDADENEDDSTAVRNAPIPLFTRATPLLDILQRAADEEAPVMWEAL